MAAAPKITTSLAQATVKHSTATQGTGYAKGQLVTHDGMIWRSRRDGNPYPPGNHDSWEIVA